MSEPLYQLEKVAFLYPRGGFRLCVESLEIARGSVVTLSGPNGSGKTTLLLLLAFLSRPASGVVRFFERDPAPVPCPFGPGRRAAVMVPYPPYLFRGTARDNLCLGLDIRRIPSSQRGQYLDPVVEALDLGPLLNVSSRALSAGQAQRVAVARALVLQPEVLLLDEPFASLDQQQSERLGALLCGWNRERGLTVVYSAHRAAALEGLPPLQVIRLAGGQVEGQAVTGESQR